MNGSRELITCVQRHGGTIGNNKLGEGRAVFEDPFEVLLESVKYASAGARNKNEWVYSASEPLQFCIMDGKPKRLFYAFVVPR